jgi:hypothetical protein
MLFLLSGGTHRIVMASASTRRWLGREAAGLVGCAWLDCIAPASREIAEAMLRGAWRADGGSLALPVLPAGGGEPGVFAAVVQLLRGGDILVEMECDPSPPATSDPRDPDPHLLPVKACLRATPDPIMGEDIATAIGREMAQATGFDRVRVDTSPENGAGERGGARYVYDAAARPSPVVKAAGVAWPEELSDAILRSPDDGEVRWLAAIEAATILSVPMSWEGRLWGRLVGEHRRPRYLSPPQRAAWTVAAEVAALRLGLRAREGAAVFAGVMDFPRCLETA